MAAANPLDLSGRVVIVTGGCRGVGRGIAVRFLEAGANVVICCRHEPDELPAGGGREAVFVEADVRDPDHVDRVVDFTVERFGRLDVLVNNAGGAPSVPLADVSPRFTAAIVTLNLVAPINLAQRANAVMQQQEEGGVIINIGSVSGMRPSPLTAAYGAAKAGLVSFAQSAAVEWAPKVRVNTVSAGLIRTEQADMNYGEAAGIAAVSATIPAGRLGEPEEIGDACLYLASPMGSYVTGANLVVHGGGETPAYLTALRSLGT